MRKIPLILLLTFLVFFFSLPLQAEEQPSLEEILSEIRALRAELREKDRRIQALEEEVRRLRAQMAEKARPAEKEAATARVEISPPVKRVTFGGQYRINSYSVHTHRKNLNASRLRLRQNLDLVFSEAFRTHLQVELGHTPANITKTEERLRVRHAVLTWAPRRDLSLEAGLLPLSDRAAEMLYSADWDYNPLALTLSYRNPYWGNFRLFAAQLNEGDEALAHDDFLHYELDWERPLSPNLTLSAFALYAEVAENYANPAGGPSSHTRPHLNYGLGLSFKPYEDLTLRAVLAGSFTDREILGTPNDASGWLLRLEAEKTFPWGSASLLFTHASGDSDGEGFLPIMALAGTYGYWGYTGILTVQGPTDTGFDDTAVNVSNNGYGLTTLQGRLRWRLADWAGLTLAAGWFGNTEAPGRDDLVGYDFLGMLTLRLHRYLTLDLGLDYAHLKDSVNGYESRDFNFAPGKEEDKLAAFSRLQAEF
ncbi:hypothetical protein FVE67_06875 [Thermosulfurimonas marina]|uniref:DUF3373 domain-containing protein n=1 Tax=Thermosulfurimonas marina TaxID=2047767 RepID=A0A6H1WTQ9_9BACT|nr:hypothetical protein [Thermosulfurimonas marina]QJA06534.1 hypothetical protein FVE67_06875 [Thermosulfurimonas marina]